jgi:hypothetical protein
MSGAGFGYYRAPNVLDAVFGNVRMNSAQQGRVLAALSACGVVTAFDVALLPESEFLTLRDKIGDSVLCGRLAEVRRWEQKQRHNRRLRV